MRRIVYAIVRRLPKPVVVFLSRIRGWFWRRQLNQFLSTRPILTRSRAVSVVIPSYNDLALLRKCLKSLSQTLSPGDEVIIVDDYIEAKNSNALQRLGEEFDVTIVLKTKRLGFAGTVNRGIEIAKNDVILLNSDIVALPGWVEALQDACERRNFQALISPKLLYPDCRIQYGGTFWARTLAPQWFAHRYAGRKFNFEPSNIEVPIWGASGASLYIPRELLTELGGLDDRYWLGFEDVDYAMRAFAIDKLSIYAPNALLFHLESATRGKHQGNRELGSMRLFWSKWTKFHTGREINRSRVHLLLGEGNGVLNDYLVHVAEQLRQRGYECSTGSSLEDVPRNAVTLFSDPAQTELVWSQNLTEGLAIRIVDDAPSDIGDQSVARFLPEFDYIATDPKIAREITSTTSWRVVDSILPSLPARPVNIKSDRTLIVTNSENAEIVRELSAIDGNFIIRETDELRFEDISHIREEGPSAILILVPIRSALVVTELLGTGIPIIGHFDSRWNEVLQDGFNCFNVPTNKAAIRERLDGIYGQPASRIGVTENAIATVESIAEQVGVLFSASIEKLAAKRGAK